tara:strand:- start:103 stop:435 length:333 start_codon:yes stop_codon:yes gene_type:complete
MEKSKRERTENKKCYLLYQQNESTNERKLLSVYQTREDATFISELQCSEEDCQNNPCFVLEDGCSFIIIEENFEKCFGLHLPSLEKQMESITLELDKLLDSMNYGDGKIE